MNQFKNIAKSAMTAFLLLSAVGCDNLLDLNPPMSQQTRNFYLTEAEAFQGLTAAYSVLNWSAPSTAGGSPQNCAFEVISEVMGDACYTGGANSNDLTALQRTQRFQMYVNDPSAEALWHKYFAGIYRCNQFLSQIDRVPFTTKDLKSEYKAEAYFLRANYYFDLVRLFGNVPIITTVLSTSDFSQTQAAPHEVYKLIANDLLTAINTMNDAGTAPALPYRRIGEVAGRVSLSAAKALLGRVWLYYTGYCNDGNYDGEQLPGVTAAEMVTMLEDVIANSGHDLMIDGFDQTNIKTAGVSPLFSTANKNNVESVFEIQYSGLSKWGDWNNREGCKGNQAIVLWGMRNSATAPYTAGWGFAPVSAKLFAKFPDGDPRRIATIINTIAGTPDAVAVTYEKGYQNTGYFNRKYTSLKVNQAPNGGDANLNYTNNYQSIRFADVLLMAAEMQVRYGDKALGYNHFLRVYRRAMGATATPADVTTSTISAGRIIQERELELALEGARYWDILRQGPTVAAAQLTNGEAGEFAVTYNTTRKGLMPIPQFDITQSRGALKQNPGYSN